MSWTKGRPSSVSHKIRKQILERDQYLCYKCGSEAHEVDHVIPWFEGGKDIYENLQAICSPCHSVKSIKEQRRGYLAFMAKSKRPREANLFD